MECLDSERDQCVISSVCGLEPRLGRALEAFFAELGGVSLADVSGGGG